MKKVQEVGVLFEEKSQSCFFTDQAVDFEPKFCFNVGLPALLVFLIVVLSVRLTFVVSRTDT